MKKGISILFVVLLCILNMVGLVDAATYHHSEPITLDETWTLAGSPHIVEHVIVKNGATLTIEPGVEVRFNKDFPNCFLIIGEIGTGTTGKLIAQGTESQKITFTSSAATPQPGDWKAITFYQNASDDSIIEHAIVEYGGYTGMIHIELSNPTIRNCIIRNSADDGINIQRSTSQISNSRFEGNMECGVKMYNSSTVLDGNQFINNGSYPVAIVFYETTLPYPVIYDTNTFSGNNPDQISFNARYISYNYTLRYIGIPYFFVDLVQVTDGATLTIEPGVEVRFNKDAYSPGLLIGEQGTTGKLIAQGTESQKIKFTSNEISPQPGDWAGIYFCSNASDDSIIKYAIVEYGGYNAMIHIDSSNPTIRNCIIRNSADIGIDIRDSMAEVSCCDITENNIGIHVWFNDFNNPTIIHNNIFGNITYGLQSSTSTNILVAENNWWGHATGPGGVAPGSGDPVSSGVDYDPWLVSISTCTMKAMPWIPLLLLDD